MKLPRLRWMFSATGVALLVVSLRMSAQSKEPQFERIFSPLYQQFDAASMTIPGSAPKDVKQENSWNTASLRGSRELHGVIEFKPGAATTFDVFRAVHRAVDAVTHKHHVEGADPRLPADAEPVLNDGKSPTYAMWMYNWENRHGELHVWLFPYPGGAKIGFAVHLLEETLR